MEYSFYFDWDLDDWLDLLNTPNQWKLLVVEGYRQVLQAKNHQIFINVGTTTLYAREAFKVEAKPSFWGRSKVVTDYARIVLTHELIASNSDCTPIRVEFQIRRAVNKLVEELIFADANTIWRYPAGHKE